MLLRCQTCDGQGGTILNNYETVVCGACQGTGKIATSTAAINTQDVDNIIVFGSLNTFRYTNWKGETELRRVIPHCIRFGSTEYYPPDPQMGGNWLLEAYDLDKKDFRTFALKNIQPR